MSPTEWILVLSIAAGLMIIGCLLCPGERRKSQRRVAKPGTIRREFRRKGLQDRRGPL